MSKRIVVVSDTQMPFEDKRAMASVIKFIGEYQPDEVIHIGDLMDYPTTGRWNKSKRGEYHGSVLAQSEYGKRNFFDPLRAVYSGPLGVLEGNHDERPRKYLAEYAPALDDATAFDFDNLLDFQGFGATKLPNFYEFAPGWLATHGHLAGIRLTQEPGRTALTAAKEKFHKSVVMGHTHRLGAVPKSYGYNNRVTKILWGFEVGNLMDMRAAQYLKGGAANWQQGFGLITVDGSHVYPTPVPILNRRFTVEGQTFTV